MNINLKKRARILAGVLAASMACASASAIDFSFSQSGFSGGTVSGSFSGEDVDGDGFLSFSIYTPSTDVITAFSLVFSGGSSLASFSLGLGDLEQIVFKANGDSIIGNDVDPSFGPEGLAAFDALTGNYFFAGDALTLASGVQGEVGNFSNGAFVESTDEATAAVSVPDAGSSAVMLGGALLGLVALGRCFSSRS